MRATKVGQKVDFQTVPGRTPANCLPTGELGLGSRSSRSPEEDILARGTADPLAIRRVGGGPPGSLRDLGGPESGCRGLNFVDDRRGGYAVTVAR